MGRIGFAISFLVCITERKVEVKIFALKIGHNLSQVDANSIGGESQRGTTGTGCFKNHEHGMQRQQYQQHLRPFTMGLRDRSTDRFRPSNDPTSMFGATNVQTSQSSANITACASVHVTKNDQQQQCGGFGRYCTI